MQPPFVTFEGGEGAGKSTQVRRLAAHLRRLGYTVAVTREPGGSPKAERYRDFILQGHAKSHGPLAETVLFAAARSDHLERTIRPALARGEWVLCDRFADSTRAYQGELGAVDHGLLNAIDRAVIGRTQPELTLILDVPTDLGMLRAAARGGQPDRYDGEGIRYHQRIRAAFLEIAKSNPERCLVIDARPQAEEVSRAIWKAVSGRFSLPA